MDKDREEYLAEKAAALEKWAEDVDSVDLKPAPLETYASTAKWINQLDGINETLVRAVADARLRGLTWSQIGELLGVSAHIARQKYDVRASA